MFTFLTSLIKLSFDITSVDLISGNLIIGGVEFLFKIRINYSSINNKKIISLKKENIVCLFRFFNKKI